MKPAALQRRKPGAPGAWSWPRRGVAIREAGHPTVLQWDSPKNIGKLYII